MLEFKNYFTIGIENIKDLTITIFTIVDDIYKETIPLEIQHRLHKEKAKLSDPEIITVSILGELLSHDTQNAWLSYVSKNMKDLKHERFISKYV